MSNIDNPDIKKKIEEFAKTISSSMPSYNSYRMTTRQKIAAGLKTNGLALNGFYRDTTSKIEQWRDKFCKTGHNIIENKNKK